MRPLGKGLLGLLGRECTYRLASWHAREDGRCRSCSGVPPLHQPLLQGAGQSRPPVVAWRSHAAPHGVASSRPVLGAPPKHLYHSITSCMHKTGGSGPVITVELEAGPARPS